MPNPAPNGAGDMKITEEYTAAPDRLRLSGSHRRHHAQIQRFFEVSRLRPRRIGCRAWLSLPCRRPWVGHRAAPRSCQLYRKLDNGFAERQPRHCSGRRPRRTCGCLPAPTGQPGGSESGSIAPMIEAALKGAATSFDPHHPPHKAGRSLWSRPVAQATEVADVCLFAPDAGSYRPSNRWDELMP